MAKFDGIETEIVVLKASDGTQKVVALEDSGGGGGTTLGMEKLNAYLSIDDGEWIEITKTVNWAKGLENLNTMSYAHQKGEFVNFTGGTASNSKGYTINIMFAAESKEQLLRTSGGATYLNGQQAVLFADDASQNGLVTLTSFSSAPQVTTPQENFTGQYGEIEMRMTWTFKSDGSPIPKMVFANTGYQSGGWVSWGYFDIPGGLPVVNGAAHTAKLKFTW